MAPIGFRSTTVADESAIRALLQQAHGFASADPTLEHRHLCWKYWEPRAGWEGSRSYILTRGGEIVAHAALVPAVCSFGNERLQVLHVIDWAARAQARGAGNALMQHIATLGDAIVTASGSEQAWPLLP
ncbi:MAG: GNAT family N-acetyltransferase, partial [Gammaproteobacteria bacterium]|nr:GNAT family N-acetyltransferase [Gammaproteobacteria bacterium]